MPVREDRVLQQKGAQEKRRHRSWAERLVREAFLQRGFAPTSTPARSNGEKVYPNRRHFTGSGHSRGANWCQTRPWVRDVAWSTKSGGGGATGQQRFTPKDRSPESRGANQTLQKRKSHKKPQPRPQSRWKDSIIERTIGSLAEKR